MKTLIAILLVVSLVFCFACTNKPELPPQQASETEVATGVLSTEPTSVQTDNLPEESPAITAPTVLCYVYSHDANGGINAFDTNHELTEELNIWKLSPRNQERADAPETREIVFDGATYQGLYDASEYIYLCSFMSDLYLGQERYFAVNSLSGELTCMGFVHNEAYYNEENAKPDLDDPRAETEAIARSFAEKFTDFEGYELMREYFDPPMQSMESRQLFDYYKYEFAKKALGEDSSDRIEIHVNSKGTVTFWRLYDVGAFDPLPEDMSRFEGVDLDAMIEAKVNECLKRDDLKYDDLEIDERRFCISPVDGSTVMFVDIKVPAEVLGKDSSAYIYIIIK